MNIAISTLVSSTKQNGVFKYISYLVEHLQEAESPHKYFIIVNREFDKALKIKASNFQKIIVDIPHHPRLIMRPVYFIWQHTMIKKILRDYKIDVFHSPNPVPLFTTFEIPYVVTIHDLAEFYVKRYSPFRQKLRIWATETSGRLVKEIVTVSEYSKIQIKTELEVSEDKIHVTYPGLTLLQSNYTEDSDFDGKLFFLHVGGSRSNKNVERIINAFQKVRENYNAELYFVGEPKFLNKKNSELSGIVHYGQVSEEELIFLYKNAHALIYPSLYEGFGLPILEAMASGTPVITSNITSMPEVGGDAVHFVDPYSVDSIRAGMEKLLNDEEYRNSLIQKGLKRYKRFSWEEAARKTIEVYEKAAKL